LYIFTFSIFFLLPSSFSFFLPPSYLSQVCERLQVREDVAGATFMAVGSSAPELFTAIVTTLITGGSEGLGTIVGSAIFNIMMIVGVTCICAGQMQVCPYCRAPVREWAQPRMV
jgi:Ca2+/Na+ antiporter